MIWILQFGYEKKNIRNIGVLIGGGLGIAVEYRVEVEVEVAQGVMLRKRDENMARKILV